MWTSTAAWALPGPEPPESPQNKDGKAGCRFPATQGRLLGDSAGRWGCPAQLQAREQGAGVTATRQPRGHRPEPEHSESRHQGQETTTQEHRGSASGSPCGARTSLEAAGQTDRWTHPRAGRSGEGRAGGSRHTETRWDSHWDPGHLHTPPTSRGPGHPQSLHQLDTGRGGLVRSSSLLRTAAT